VVNRLEMLRQGKKTAEELIMEFLRLSHKIFFSDDVLKTIDGWMEGAIQYNSN
jgi:hypothetical protein